MVKHDPEKDPLEGMSNDSRRDFLKKMGLTAASFIVINKFSEKSRAQASESVPNGNCAEKTPESGVFRDSECESDPMNVSSDKDCALDHPLGGVWCDDQCGRADLSSKGEYFTDASCGMKSADNGALWGDVHAGKGGFDSQGDNGHYPPSIPSGDCGAWGGPCGKKTGTLYGGVCPDEDCNKPPGTKDNDCGKQHPCGGAWRDSRCGTKVGGTLYMDNDCGKNSCGTIIWYDSDCKESHNDADCNIAGINDDDCKVTKKDDDCWWFGINDEC